MGTVSGQIEKIYLNDNGSVTVSVDGRKMSAWPPTANKVKNFNEGNAVTVEYKEVVKGDRTYYNVTGISSGSGSPSGQPVPVSQTAVGNTGKPDSNVMMMVRYALDAMPQGAAKTPTEAVDLVYELYQKTKEKLAAQSGKADAPKPVSL